MTLNVVDRNGVAWRWAIPLHWSRPEAALEKLLIRNNPLAWINA